MKSILPIAIFCLLNFSLHAQSYDKDVQSVDAIINTLYEVISGEAGATRDWNRFKNLFTADAKLMPTSKSQDGKITHLSISPDEYIQRFQTRISTGFFEKELNRVTNAFGTIINVFSTYETKEQKDGPVTNRGINSIQLLKAHDRYYVIQILWCGENTGFRLPDNYLKGRIE